MRGGLIAAGALAVVATGLWGAGRYNEVQFAQQYARLQLPYTQTSRTLDPPPAGPLNPAGAQFATYQYAATGTRQAVAAALTSHLQAAGYTIAYQSTRIMYAYNNHDQINLVITLLPTLPPRTDADSAADEPQLLVSSLRVDAGRGLTHESSQ